MGLLKKSFGVTTIRVGLYSYVQNSDLRKMRYMNDDIKPLYHSRPSTWRVQLGLEPLTFWLTVVQPLMSGPSIYAVYKSVVISSIFYVDLKEIDAVVVVLLVRYGLCTLSVYA